LSTIKTIGIVEELTEIVLNEVCHSICDTSVHHCYYLIDSTSQLCTSHLRPFFSISGTDWKRLLVSLPLILRNDLFQHFVHADVVCVCPFLFIIHWSFSSLIIFWPSEAYLQLSFHKSMALVCHNNQGHCVLCLSCVANSVRGPLTYNSGAHISPPE